MQQRDKRRVILSVTTKSCEPDHDMRNAAVRLESVMSSDDSHVVVCYLGNEQ